MGYGLMDGQRDGPTDESTDPSIDRCVCASKNSPHITLDVQVELAMT